MDTTSPSALKARRIFFTIAIAAVSIYAGIGLALSAGITFGFKKSTIESLLSAAGPILGIILLMAYPVLRMFFALRDRS